MEPFLFKSFLGKWYSFSKTHMRARKIVKSLKEYRLLPQVFSLFTKARCFSDQWCQEFPEGQIQSFKQRCYDLQAQFSETFSSTLYSMGNGNKFTFLFFFDHLPIYQFRMRFLDGVFGTSLQACFGKCFNAEEHLFRRACHKCNGKIQGHKAQSHCRVVSARSMGLVLRSGLLVVCV